jgi:hypothetical protein
MARKNSLNPFAEAPGRVLARFPARFNIPGRHGAKEPFKVPEAVELQPTTAYLSIFSIS